MEIAPGTDAVTPRAAAPMVAVPLAGQALLARSPGFGGTMPGMTTKVALRRAGCMCIIYRDITSPGYPTRRGAQRVASKEAT